MKRGHRSPEWAPLAEAGFSAFEGGNFDMAMNFFRRAIDKGCRDGLVYFRMGIYYESGEDFARAKKYFRLARSHLPGRYSGNIAAKTIHEHLGRVLFTLGDLPGAEEELQQALRLQGPNFTILFLLGSIARQKGDDEKVIDYYSKAVAYPPPHGIVPHETLITLMVEVGEAQFRLGQHDRSLDTWKRLLQIVPNHPLARQYKDRIERQMIKGQTKGEEERILEDLIQ